MIGKVFVDLWRYPNGWKRKWLSFASAFPLGALMAVAQHHFGWSDTEFYLYSLPVFAVSVVVGCFIFFGVRPEPGTVEKR